MLSIYTTGKVGFADTYHPYNIYSEQVAISMMNNPGGGHNSITLQGHLTNLFTTLLAENTQDTLSFLMSCHYAYATNPDLESISIPLIMQPLVEETVKPIPTSMISHWTNGIKTWFAKHTPDQAKGGFYFDLTIYANLTQKLEQKIRIRHR